LEKAERAEHLKARDIGQVQVENDDIAVVQLAEIDAVLAQLGRKDIEALGFEHQLD
jgi:hypothetical protein